MTRWPRISIVTPSFNQVRYVAETIESVMAQGYPDLEHIVVDGASTDGSVEILARYPHLRVVSEPDRGHADALNKGFRLATGQILGFLNSDDTLMPGALHRVAREIDPARDRLIVMGRCRFIDEQGRFVGIEHPSHFESHRRVLEVWKGHTIPQPAVFWTPEVWRTCGPMDETLRTAWIDYDLFCRFSRAYRFHFIDQVLAQYRLHAESQTGRFSEQARLEESIALSRRHWGSPATLTYWRLALSLARHRFDRVGRARRLLGRTRESWRRGERWRAAPSAVAGAVLAPEVTFFVAVYPPLLGRATGLWRRALARMAPGGVVSPRTAAYLERAEPWADGWVGPRLILSRSSEQTAGSVRLRGWADVSYMRRALVLTISLDGRLVGRHHVPRTGDFDLDLRLAEPAPPGPHTVEVQASAWFVSHPVTGSEDHRPLAWKLGELELRR
ncbi:MAG TPA: glycosyltransferase family 2 protein [Candidatus Methylomirabilis sp.]|nr:glycosyltransferase family 2 protein [Candidatus Methylomirabilis sp.]